MNAYERVVDDEIIGILGAFIVAVFSSRFYDRQIVDGRDKR